MSDPWSKETNDKVIERLTEAFDLADGLRKAHQAEIVRLNDALKDAQTDNLNLRRDRNELRKRVKALEAEARWRANGAFLDKPDPAAREQEDSDD